MSIEVRGSICAAIASLLLVSCAHDRCSNTPQRPPASEPGPSPAPNPGPGQAGQNGPTDEPAAKAAPPPGSVQISIPTGEKQCGLAKGKALGDFQLLLAQKKITVYESHTQSDGKMHMALCGSPSGMLHVFTISQKDLKKAQRLGFKQFENVNQ